MSCVGAAARSPWRAPQPARSRSELVDKARRTLRIRAGDYQRLALELAQAIGEDVRRDPLDIGLQLPETTRTVEQGGDEEQGPAIANGGKRVCERRTGGVAVRRGRAHDAHRRCGMDVRTLY
jgi:hypothetical protein